MLTRVRRRDAALFFVPLLLYAVNQQIKHRVKWEAAGYLLRCHANDYLGGIAFAAYLNLVIALSRWPARRLHSPLQFVAAGLLCGLFWEGIAPLFLARSTGDWLDVAAYLLGMLTYWALGCRGTPRGQGGEAQIGPPLTAAPEREGRG